MSSGPKTIQGAWFMLNSNLCDNFFFRSTAGHVVKNTKTPAVQLVQIRLLGDFSSKIE